MADEAPELKEEGSSLIIVVIGFMLAPFVLVGLVILLREFPDRLGLISLVSVQLFLFVVGLLHLRKAPINEVARGIWAALVVLVPILGAVAVLIVRPGSLKQS